MDVKAESAGYTMEKSTCLSMIFYFFGCSAISYLCLCYNPHADHMRIIVPMGIKKLDAPASPFGSLSYKIINHYNNHYNNHILTVY
jgi:hypothetical protein